MTFALEPWLAQRRALVERALQLLVDGWRGRAQAGLAEAMAYSLLAGGKRLRPVLTLASAEAVGGRQEGAALDFACALELVHTYSLIHDDLPAMDDDDLRRGRPTSHKVFGEAMAILAGDALLTEAFAVLGRGPEPVRGQLCGMLAEAAGACGMVGGQADDVREDRPPTLDFLESLHARKTGALIAVACAGGAAAAGARDATVARLERYGRQVGLAFQIADDLMDLAADPARTGKSGGSDARNAKLTYPGLVGRDESLRRARAAVAEAKQALEGLASDRTAPLRALADFAVERDH